MESLPLRDALIAWHERLKVQWLGVSSSDRVVLGKHHELFYAGEDSIEDFRCSHPFEASELERWRRALEWRRDWLEARHTHYLFVIVPSKHTIYPELMPSALNRVGKESRLDQLVVYLRENSNLKVLDLRPGLQAAKRRQRVYYKTDHHWNDYGAYIGYQQIAGAMSRWYPSLLPLAPDRFSVAHVETAGKGLSSILGSQSLIREPDVKLIPRFTSSVRESDSGVLADCPSYDLAPGPLRYGRYVGFEQHGGTIRRGILVSDSYGLGIQRLLAEHFERLVHAWTYSFDRALIQREHPDIVIQEMVEYKLMELSPERPEGGGV